MNDACVCVDSYDHADVYVAEMVKARKAHKCCECEDPIKPGDRYEYVRGLWDGYWSTFKTCQTCVAIRNDYFNCGFLHGSMWEDLREHFLETSTAEELEEDDLSWLM